MTLFYSMTSLSFPPPFALLVPILFLATVIISKRSNPFSSSLNVPRRPPPLPIIGNLHQVGVLSHNSLWSLSKTYGPLMHLRLGSVPALVVSSAKLAREVMKHQDLNFCSRPSFVSQKRLSYNFLYIGLAPCGKYWREKRKDCMVELFSPKRIESFGFIREKEVARMIQSISKSYSSFKPINLSDMLLTLNK